MILRRSSLSLALAALALCCAPSGREDLSLSADERAFVDTYVRILVLDAWRLDAPDSVHTEMDRMAATYDSTRVQAALRRLAAEPERWGRVYGAIASRLHALERETTPREALRKLDSGEVIAEEPATRPAAPRIPSAR